MNARLANAIGRPDLHYSANYTSQSPTTVVGGSAGADIGSPVTGGGRSIVLALMGLIVVYAGYTYWVRHHLA